MKSTIRVDFSGNGSQHAFAPVIRVKVEQTDDTRDKLLKTFFQQLGGDSNLLQVEFVDNENIVIYPVLPTELTAIANKILENKTE